MEEGQIQIEKLDPETEFLLSKRQTGNEWELFKENVRPLKRGRKVHLLNEALKSHNDNQLKKSLLENRRFYFLSFTLWTIFLWNILWSIFLIDFFMWGFRRLIEAIDEYQGDDPLQPWLEWVLSTPPFFFPDFLAWFYHFIRRNLCHIWKPITVRSMIFAFCSLIFHPCSLTTYLTKGKGLSQILYSVTIKVETLDLWK